MSDQTPLDVEAIRARLDAATVTDGRSIGAIQNGKKELRRHAPTDLRSLLDEEKRLRTQRDQAFAAGRTAVQERDAAIAKLAARDRTVEVLTEREAAIKRDSNRVIREAAADNAKLTELESGAAAVQQIHRVETYAFGTKTSLGHRTGCYVCKTDGPCPTFTAASEVPRPPAEEAQERPEVSGTGSGRGTGVAEALGTAQKSASNVAIPKRLTEPQRQLLEEIRESSTGGLYVDRYMRYYRTAKALERRGLVTRTFVDGRNDFFAPAPAPSLPVPSTEERQ